MSRTVESDRAAAFGAALETPAALVEVATLERNLQLVAAEADAAGISMRPHVKTHKSVRIARRQLELGAVGVTCATLDEAAAMVDSGIGDVLLYYPVVGERSLARLVELATRGSVTTTVDGLDVMDLLDAAARRRGVRIDVLVDVDTGLGRTGVPLSEVDALVLELDRRPGLQLVGLGTHEGFSYALRDPGERDRVVGERLAEFAEVGSRLGVPRISCGSTPSIATALRTPGITEIRPGNYAFYDRMQVDLGVATSGDCALSVLATVVSVRDADRAIIDAGSKAVTSDIGAHGVGSLTGHGMVEGRPEMSLAALSEEHGFLDTAGVRLSVGEQLRIVPNHACTCTAAVGVLTFVEGDEVVAIEPIAGRRGGGL